MLAVCCFEQSRPAPIKGARIHWARVPWCHAMQEFMRNQNLEKFRRLLEKTTDADQRRTLLRLQAEEEAKRPPRLEAKGDGA